MKKPLKIIGKSALFLILTLVIWCSVFFGCLMNWGNITAAQLELKYRLLGYPQNGIVLAGSSTLQMWTGSEADLGPLSSVNVGIGGTVIDNWLDYASTLIVPFSPKAVVIYVGANDLHNFGDSPETAFYKLSSLFDFLHRELPESHLYFVSVYSTGAHPKYWENDIRFNQLAENHAAQTAYLTYIDVASALLTEDGTVRNEVFQEDLVHLNDYGYRIWTEEIRNTLFNDMGGAYEK